MSKTRTFVALSVNDEIRHRAAELAKSLRTHADDVRWTRPENYHWTLQFVGDVSDGQLSELCARVAEGVVDFEPFALAARGVGAFPSSARPRTLWLGAGQGYEEVVELHAAVESSLASMDLRSENRKYVPHITLGRVGRMRSARRLAAMIDKFTDFEAGETVAEEVIVFASQMTRDGSRYHVVGRAALGG